MKKLLNWFRWRCEKRRIRPGMLVTSDSYGGLYVVHRGQRGGAGKKGNAPYVFCHLTEIVPGSMKMCASASYDLHSVKVVC